MSERKLIVIGENINTTRRIRADSPNIVRRGDRFVWLYKDLDGSQGGFDVTDAYPREAAQQKTGRVGHIGHAVRTRDMKFLTWAILSQVNAGAHIVDLCCDELSVYPEERKDHMRWLVKAAQSIAKVPFAIDSSDPETIKAGLEVYDRKHGRPAINSVSLEPGRDVLIDLAKEKNCIIFGNGSGTSGMPQDAEERVDNLTRLMAMMDKVGVPHADIFLDPLVFPVGAGPEYGKHFLDAVKELRRRLPDVHIFGGLSNVSFGLPRRKLLNHAFITLAIINGCDAIMIDPLMNDPNEYVEFKYAADVMTAEDEYALNFLSYVRGSKKAAA
jgi:5-methyltetrahydrofolate--homocysteine methyltransferase